MSSRPSSASLQPSWRHAPPSLGESQSYLLHVFHPMSPSRHRRPAEVKSIRLFFSQNCRRGGRDITLIIITINQLLFHHSINHFSPRVTISTPRGERFESLVVCDQPRDIITAIKINKSTSLNLRVWKQNSLLVPHQVDIKMLHSVFLYSTEEQRNVKGSTATLSH